ncbi:MAG: thiolase family protein [Dehalococcoidia bacterium]|nr:thiolase family protein [Dehalococcoidia bacterium]
MNDVVLLGVGMTTCGKFLERSLYDMTKIAVGDALKDAGISIEQVEAAYCGNLLSPWGYHEEHIFNFTGVIGQELLKPLGIGSIAVHNTRNACGTGGAAFQLAFLDIAAGFHDCVLVMAIEKGYMPDREQYLRMMSPPLKPGETTLRYSAPVEQMSQRCRHYMQKYGLTKQQIAWVCSKNHINASLNPFAQYRKPYTVEEVLADKPVVEPFTRCMCAPNGDGGAAAILCSRKFAQRYTTSPIFVATSVVRKGNDHFDPDQPALDERVAREAEERAGIAPSDIGVLELADATTWTEITGYWGVGLCKKEDAPAFIDSKATALTGKYPVNTSGGMESRGEPFGATGMLQITEVVWQMRGMCKERQVAGPPKVGLSQIAGGWQDWDAEDGICAAAIFKR